MYRELFHSKPRLLPGADIRRSYRDIAKALGVDEDTVRNRVEGMQKSGFLRGFYVIPNPNLVGVKILQAWFDVPPNRSKKDVIEQVKRVPNVTTIVDCYGQAFYAYVAGDSDPFLQKSVALIEGIVGAEAHPLVTPGVPPSEYRMSPMDWHIVQSLRRDPRRSCAAIAKALGLSSKTVRRHLEQMVRETALFTFPQIDGRAIRGIVPAVLVVLYNSPTAKAAGDRAVAGRLKEILLGAEVGNPEHSVFFPAFGNVSEADATGEWVRALPGVRFARLDFLVDRMDLHDHIDLALEKAAATL